MTVPAVPDPGPLFAALDAQLAELHRLIAIVRTLVVASRTPSPPPPPDGE